MITVKDAVKHARHYISDVIADVADLQLEEVEASLHGDWEVTLSYLRPLPKDSPPSPVEIHSDLVRTMLGSKEQVYERVYKVVSVDKDSGECRSIKIKQFQ